jgi:hypothetical protein
MAERCENLCSHCDHIGSAFVERLRRERISEFAERGTDSYGTGPGTGSATNSGAAAEYAAAPPTSATSATSRPDGSADHVAGRWR